MRGINGHRHRSNGGHRLLQGILITCCHINVAGAFGTDVFRLEPALAILNKEKRERKKKRKKKKSLLIVQAASNSRASTRWQCCAPLTEFLSPSLFIIRI